jgi:hypothetical protein
MDHMAEFHGLAMVSTENGYEGYGYFDGALRVMDSNVQDLSVSPIALQPEKDGSADEDYPVEYQSTPPLFLLINKLSQQLEALTRKVDALSDKVDAIGNA